MYLQKDLKMKILGMNSYNVWIIWGWKMALTKTTTYECFVMKRNKKNFNTYQTAQDECQKRHCWSSRLSFNLLVLFFILLSLPLMGFFRKPKFWIQFLLLSNSFQKDLTKNDGHVFVIWHQNFQIILCLSIFHGNLLNSSFIQLRSKLGIQSFVSFFVIILINIGWITTT